MHRPNIPFRIYVSLQLKLHAEATQNLKKINPLLAKLHKNSTLNLAIPDPKGYLAVFIKFSTTYLPAFSVEHLLSITNVYIVQNLTMHACKKPRWKGNKPKLCASMLKRELCKVSCS
jgi:hypothetical protein